MLVITLALIVILFVMLSGYFSFQFSNEKEKNQEKSRENATLLGKLRDPSLERKMKNAQVASVNIQRKKITIEGTGKDLVFDVTDSSVIQREVLAMDRKTRVWQNAKLSDIKEGKRVDIRFNGLKEVVYLSFKGK